MSCRIRTSFPQIKLKDEEEKEKGGEGERVKRNKKVKGGEKKGKHSSMLYRHLMRIQIAFCLFVLFSFVLLYCVVPPFLD